MARSCPHCSADVADDARFCSSCGTPLVALAGAERKLATMVFADLVGSTRLATTMDPEDLRRRLASFFDLARDTLAEHGGTVEKYIGDAVLAVFGVPRAYGDDPDRAVAAGIALVERMCHLGDGLAVRVGIETGEVLATNSGSDLSVTGEAVNAAARLQAAARENEVLVGERTARSCRRVTLEPRGAIDAKGFDGPLQAWRATESEAIRRGTDAPFIGREDDLELLRLVYRRAVRERTPQLVTITGDAGIGKTRLTAELVAAITETEPKPRVLVGRNPPYGRGIAFWALAEILRGVAGAGPDDSVDDVRAALRDRLVGLGAEDAEPVAGALAAAMGGTVDSGDVEDALRRGWRRLVGLLASERPLLIVIDDAHWADDGLLDLIEEVAFRLEDAPVVVISTARPELLERRADFGRAARNVTQLELRPLPRDATRSLAAELLGEGADGVADRVAEASGGNPFFTEEVARSILDEGAGDGAGRLPDTVQAAVSARLDLLPATEKRVLQYAAILGQGFDRDQLAQLLDHDPGEPLDALAARALLRERAAMKPGRWAFRHQLIHEVAYSTLPRAERARLHERAAAALEAHAADRPELAEVIAFHRVQAAEHEASPERKARARAASITAAEIVFRRGASLRSQELYVQAADLASDHTERIESLCSAAEVATRAFRGDQALALHRRTAAVAEEAGNGAAVARSYAAAVEIATRMAGMTGQLPEHELRAMLDRGNAFADQADTPTRARLVLDEAWLHWGAGRSGQMAPVAERALALAREEDDPVLLSSALDAASASRWNDGHYGDALSLNRERLDLLAAISSSDPAIEVERSDALHMVIECLGQLGRFREALEYSRRARDSDLDRGIVYSGWARSMIPTFQLGLWAEVLTAGARAREAWTAMERPPSTFMAGNLATAGGVLGYRDRMAEFEDWMAFAEEMGGGGGQVLLIHILKADVALHRGEVERAVRALETAPVELSFWWHSLYAATRAEVLARAEDPGAADAIREAEAAVGDSRPAQALLARARGLMSGDEAELRLALAEFEAMEMSYQAARTAWLLGDAESRERATATFERLGTPPPA